MLLQRALSSLPPFVFFSYSCYWTRICVFFLFFLVLCFQAAIHATFKDLSILNLIPPYPILHVPLSYCSFTTIVHHPLLFDLLLEFWYWEEICIRSEYHAVEVYKNPSKWSFSPIHFNPFIRLNV